MAEETRKWTVDSSGNHIMPPDQSEFLDWLLTPKNDRQPESQAQWAREHEIRADTVRTWKKDPRFKDEWRRRADETVVSTERISAVMDAMWQQACIGNVQAATLYMNHAARLLPPKEVAEDEEFKHLSDEELVDFLGKELGFTNGSG